MTAGGAVVASVVERNASHTRQRLVAGAVLLALCMGCTGGRELPTGTRPLGQAGSPSASSSLVGTWRRILFFNDVSGAALSSETVWTFRGDGTATRVVIARNYTAGTADQLTASARWAVEGTTLVVTFLAPDPGTARFPFQVDGAVLVLAGQAYNRQG
jgi:hypothetical protein